VTPPLLRLKASGIGESLPYLWHLPASRAALPRAAGTLSPACSARRPPRGGAVQGCARRARSAWHSWAT